MDIESISLEPIALENPSEQEQTHNMTWSYPTSNSTENTPDPSLKLQQKKKRHSLSNRHFVFDDLSASLSDDEKLMEKNLSDDMKKVIIQSTEPGKKSTQINPMSKSMFEKPSPSAVTVLDISDYMKIPSLWNKMEKVGDELDIAQEADDSIDVANEWEIV